MDVVTRLRPARAALAASGRRLRRGRESVTWARAGGRGAAEVMQEKRGVFRLTQGGAPMKKRVFGKSCC